MTTSDFSIRRRAFVGLLSVLVMASVLTLAPRRAAEAAIDPFGWCVSPNAVRRASVSPAGVQGNDTSFDAAMAADGGHVAYSSYASNLIAGDTNNSLDSYVTDLATGAVSRASLGVNGVQGNANSVAPVTSRDGKVVSFYSSASNLAGGDANTAANYFGSGYTYMTYGGLAAAVPMTVETWFKTTGTGPIIGYSNAATGATPTQWVSVVYVGTDGKLRGQFWNGAASPMTTAAAVNDGQWHHVALTASASSQSMYVDNVLIGTKTGAINHLQMYLATIGAAFGTSWPGANAGWQYFSGKIDEVAVYWKTLSAARIAAHYAARTNNYTGSVMADAPSMYYRLADPYSTNTAADASGFNRPGAYQNTVGREEYGALTVDGNDYDDVYVRDVAGSATSRASVSSAGVEGNKESLFPDITPDGRYVTFYSAASNLVAGDTNARGDIFRRDRVTNTTTRVSVSSAGAQGNNGANNAAISDDGRYVAIMSYDSNLVAGDTNNKADIFVRDIQTGTTERVSTSSSNVQGTDDSYYGDISGDGRYVTFYSFASNLVAGDTNAAPDIFIKDRQTGQLTRASTSTTGGVANGGSYFPSVSGNGRYVAYQSLASNLVSGDTNAQQDVFVYDRTTGSQRRVSVTAAGAQANSSSESFSPGVLSANGLKTAFGTGATNLVSGDTNSLPDVYVMDNGPVDSPEYSRFVNLWLPRLSDQTFVTSLLATSGYSAAILAEGFHGLSDTAKHALVTCLAAWYVVGQNLSEGIDEYYDYANEAIFRLIFDKDHLGNDERTAAGAVGNAISAASTLADGTLGALPVGRLPNMLGPGVLTAGSLIGGNPLFDANPVGGLQGVASALAPAAPPLPALGRSLEGIGQLTDVKALAFQLLNNVTYTVRVEKYTTGGVKVGDFTETGKPLCQPITMSSLSGSGGLPSSHDLRINLCPNPSSFVPGGAQKLAINADALAVGVRARLTFTVGTLLAGSNSQLQTVVDASTTDVPLETGLGSTAPFPCNQNTLPPTLPPAQTRSGFCAELTATSLDPGNGANTITTFSSAPITSFAASIQRFQGTTPVPVGDLALDAVPDADDHALTVTAQTPSLANGRQATARVQLTNVEASPANPAEALRLTQYGGTGARTTALSVTDLPDAFDGTFTAVLDAANSPRSLELRGTSDLSPATVYRLEQFANGATTATGAFEIRAFARDYTYATRVLRNDATQTDIGVEVTGTFALGAPADTSQLQVTDTNRGAELLLRSFSTSTTLKGTVDDPANPTTFDLHVANAQAKPGQVGRIVLAPSGATPVRLLLAGASANLAEFVDPPTGRALRWTATPQSYDVHVGLTTQADGSPSTVVLNSTSSDAPSAGLIAVRDNQANGDQLVLSVLSPSVDQDITLTLAGQITNPSHVRIDRNNNESRPGHALQLAVIDSAGVKAKVTFAGASADMSRLIGGTGRDIEGIATSVPAQAFTYDLRLDLTTSPQVAEISGSSTPAGAGMDIELRDTGRNLRLHQRNLPASYDYLLNAYANGSRIQRAVLRAVSQSAAVADGLLELEFGGLAASFSGFAQTFTYDFTVDGNLDNPTGLHAALDQSGPNPNQLIQLAKGITGADADFAVTFRNPGVTPVRPEIGRSLDILAVGLPEDLNLDATLEQTGAHQTARVVSDRHGADSSTATMRMRRTKDGETQEVRVLGLAPAMEVRVSADGPLSAPTRATVEAYRTVAHATDVVQTIRRVGTAVHQNVVAQGASAAALPTTDQGGPVAVTGERTDATLNGLGEGLRIEFSTCSNLGATDGSCVDGDRSTDGRERLGFLLRSFDVGASLAAPMTMVRSGASLVADLMSDPTKPARRLEIGDLAAELRARYVGPKPAPGAGDSCLGDIDYTATDSQTDFRLIQFMGPVFSDGGQKLGDGCYPDSGPNATAGQLELNVTDMPSLGFELATVRRDGTAQFRTRMSGAARQVVTMVRVVAPVPDSVAAFVNQDRRGANAIDTTICPEAVACIKFNYSGNPHYVNTRLVVDAPFLTEVEVRTNIAASGGATTPPAGSNSVQSFLWQLLPILGVRNAGTGEVTVKLLGDDDPTQSNSLDIHIGCCMGTWSTANHNLHVPLDNYPDLQVGFYGWYAQEFLAPNGGVKKMNDSGEELANSRGNKVKFHPFLFTPDADVPFGPKFITNTPQASNGQFDESKSNGFKVPGGKIAYFVPNLLDMFAAQPTDTDGDGQPNFSPGNVNRRAWYARARLYQTNWYWYGLLHMLQPNPHGFPTS